MPATDTPAHPRIAIVGSGAVGCLYGGRLAHAGHDVHFLIRSGFDHVREHGLHVQSTDGDFHIDHPNIHQNPTDIGPVDLVLIALKTTANHALTELLPPLLKEDTLLLTLQNGLGNEEFLTDNFGQGRVIGGLCFVCAHRIAPGQVSHTAQGRISIGEHRGAPQRRTHAIAETFQQSGIGCTVVENLATEKWRKLVWNIPFNGLSITAGGIDTAQILADRDLARQTRALMLETIDIARALGHDIPTSFAEEMVQTTHPMGPYQPSSLIDHLHGREVELESIWGEPLRRGLAAGAKVEQLQALYHQLQDLTA